jgi:protein-S-isoprenylcysteine O-methyltransferase Ste14
VASRGAPVWAVLGTALGAPLFVSFFLVYVPYLLCGFRVAPAWRAFWPARALGAALVVAAVPVIVDFALRFVREGHGTPIPIAPPQRLVVRGVYRWVRNPAYVAAIVALLGEALWFASAAVAEYALALGLAFHAMVVLHEEPALRRAFGDEYAAYARRVSRWIPRPPRA